MMPCVHAVALTGWFRLGSLFGRAAAAVAGDAAVAGGAAAAGPAQYHRDAAGADDHDAARVPRQHTRGAPYILPLCLK